MKDEKGYTMTPLDALDRAIQRGIFDSVHRREPGGIIAHMPEEVREALRELRSDDIANVRIEEARLPNTKRP